MKLHRFFAILMMIVLGASFFVACGDINGGVSGNSGDNGSGTNDNGTNITITETSISIEITSYPDKVYYQVNEIFDPTGLVLSAVITEKYSDGTEKKITEEIAYPNENISFSGTDFSTEGTKIITVIYTKSELVAYTSFEVTVGSLIEKTLDSISIKTLPTKTEYKVNEEFDPTGLEITANYTNYYSDNSTMSYSNDISYENNMSFSGTDFSTAGTKTITVTYTENETSKSATFEITVKSAAFSSIINYTKFDSELNPDLSLYNGKAMTLYLDTTTVNIATLFTQFKTLYDAVGENGSVSISYANAANTTIEGDFGMTDLVNAGVEEGASKYVGIKSFINAITPKTQDLPTISVRFGGNNLNLYHTGLGDLFNLYFDNNAGDKLPSKDNMYLSTSYFDAIDYLNKKGGIAYDAANQYTGNYYNLDVNAALLMGADLKNVNITGTLEQDAVFANELTNVRFNIDANGKKFDTGVNGIGLIEFAGDAPSQTPNVYSGRIIIQNAKSPITFGNGFSVDVSNLSEDAINNYVNQSTAGFVEAIYPTEATANSTKFTPSVIYAAGNLIKNTANDYSYATNQQWVKAANEDKWIEYGGLLKYPNVSALSAKANLDEKNNTLLNTILFNNQKVYNS